MTSVGFENVYRRVLKRVLDTTCIEGQKRGVLYSTIAIILGEENSEYQEETKEICRNLSIKESASIDDDYNLVSSSLINVLSIESSNEIPWFNSVVSHLKELDKNRKDEDDKMKWIIIGACILVGLLACIQYLRGKESQASLAKNQKLPERNTPPPIPVVTVALCLVVTASEVENPHAVELSRDDLFHLIDNASYFLCTDTKSANENEKMMEIIPIQGSYSDSKQDIYIRVSVDDGYRLKDTKIRYKIKDNLPIRESYKVEKIACLSSLSGIEKLIRV